MSQESRTVEEKSKGKGDTVPEITRGEYNPIKSHTSVGTSAASTRKSYQSGTRRLAK